MIFYTTVSTHTPVMRSLASLPGGELSALGKLFELMDFEEWSLIRTRLEKRLAHLPKGQHISKGWSTSDFLMPGQELRSDLRLDTRTLAFQGRFAFSYLGNLL